MKHRRDYGNGFVIGRVDSVGFQLMRPGCTCLAHRFPGGASLHDHSEGTYLSVKSAETVMHCLIREKGLP